MPFWVILVFLLLTRPCWGFAGNESAKWTNQGISPAGKGGINLDLSSSTSTDSAAKLLHGNSVSITIGNKTSLITPSSRLTPAEAIAVKQRQLTGNQFLLLSTQGKAIGITADLFSAGGAYKVAK